MFPFHFLDRLGKHDVTCTVSGGGRSAQAGAIRLAMARALCTFVTEEEVEWMRQGMSWGGRGPVVPILSVSVYWILVQSPEIRRHLVYYAVYWLLFSYFRPITIVSKFFLQSELKLEKKRGHSQHQGSLFWALRHNCLPSLISAAKSCLTDELVVLMLSQKFVVCIWFNDEALKVFLSKIIGDFHFSIVMLVLILCCLIHSVWLPHLIVNMRVSSQFKKEYAVTLLGHCFSIYSK